jgi:hypothetical protein
MSTTLEKFWKAMAVRIKPDDEEALNLLISASYEWEEEKQYFNAAHALSITGSFPGKANLIVKAISLYQKSADSTTRHSSEGLAALIELASELNQLVSYTQVDKRKFLRVLKEEIWEEIGQLLFMNYKNSPYAENYLVRGVLLSYDFQGNWMPSYPDFEVDWGVKSWSTEKVIIHLPSAFHLFIALADYEGAQKVIENCPNAFTSPGLKGWKAAVRGFLNPDEAPEMFKEAGDAFSTDTEPTREELMARGGTWSSINIDLWSKYFHSRSALAAAVREPIRVREFIREAASAVQGEYGWHHRNASRYRILIKTLAELSGEESGLNPLEAIEQFKREVRISGEESDDSVTIQFLTLAAEAFEGFKTNPELEITTGRLPKAFEALERIPLFGPEIAGVVKHPIGKNLYTLKFSQIPTWIYRTLESIGGKRGEEQLRKIILRLAQSSYPLYAQILHGPLEYGRDIVVLQKCNDHHELHMYQVKCGDMTIPDWRTSHEQLEEMFQTQFPESIIPAGLYPLWSGILIYNGHPNPQVAPLIDGWLKEQRKDHERIYKLMNLDDIVQWISRDRLVNEFRKALSELGLTPKE